MPVRNHNLVYRPLVGGIAVINPAPGPDEIGTLGFVATSDGHDRWIVSCYHVLGRPAGAPVTDGEPVYQPYPSPQYLPIARTVVARSSPALDCAAALVEPHVPTGGGILGLHVTDQPIAAAVGMRVIKSGAETGITEGVVERVHGAEATIGVPQGFPWGYELSDRSDSGALWVDKATGAPVLLHIAGNDTGPEKAYGIGIAQVLATMTLRILT